MREKKNIRIVHVAANFPHLERAQNVRLLHHLRSRFARAGVKRLYARLLAEEAAGNVRIVRVNWTRQRDLVRAHARALGVRWTREMDAAFRAPRRVRHVG